MSNIMTATTIKPNGERREVTVPQDIDTIRALVAWCRSLEKEDYENEE